jgi:4-amino-4-deoxy-L-arabinose transferase-like glycosyltransferase
MSTTVILCDRGSLSLVIDFEMSVSVNSAPTAFDRSSTPPAVGAARTRAIWSWRALALVATLGAALAVLRTARVFSATFDEPAHLAAGLQWLSTGHYFYDTQHPPLARVVAALGPYLTGARTVGLDRLWNEGGAILGSGQHYADTLALARYGEVVFLLIGALAVWLWGRRLLGEAGGALATLLLVTNPTLLAHSGLVTNDAAVAALGTLALYATLVWLERPGWRLSCALGVAFALAITAKFSALPFVGVVLAIGYVLRGLVGHVWAIPGSRATGARADRGPSRAAAVAVVVVAMLLTIWAVYRFAFGHIWAVRFRVPAPALWAGLYTFLMHGGTGHPAFLLGRVGETGWWYYFPVALLVKTPLPLLLLTAVGGLAAWRATRRDRNWEAALPACGAIAIVALSTQVHVNIGVRHVLSVYPLMAIVAAQGVLFLWHGAAEQRIARALAVVAVAVALIVPARAFPDLLAYFNPLAGSHPERVLVDSNLDWGQDLYRLRDTLRARQVTEPVKMAYFGSSDPRAVGIPNAVPLAPNAPTDGWIVASKTYLAGEWVDGGYAWLRQYQPLAKIGKSLLLWHLVARPTEAPRVTTEPSPRSIR